MVAVSSPPRVYVTPVVHNILKNDLKIQTNEVKRENVMVEFFWADKNKSFWFLPISSYFYHCQILGQDGNATLYCSSACFATKAESSIAKDDNNPVCWRSETPLSLWRFAKKRGITLCSSSTLWGEGLTAAASTDNTQSNTYTYPTSIPCMIFTSQDD